MWAGTRSCCLRASFSRSALGSKGWDTVTAARTTWRHWACAVWSNTTSQSQVQAHFAHPLVRLRRHCGCVGVLRHEFCLFSQVLSCSSAATWLACIAAVHPGRFRIRPGVARLLTLWSWPCPSPRFCSWTVMLQNVRVPQKKSAHTLYTKNRHSQLLSFNTPE